MRLEKKIFFEREDTLKDILTKLSRTSAPRITINIAKNSILGSSIENFHMLRHTSEEQKKNIIIESIDEHILELATLAQIQAVNPVFRVRERSVLDILPKTRSIEIPAIAKNQKSKEGKRIDEGGEEVEMKITEYTEQEEARHKKKSKKARIGKKSFVVVITIIALCGAGGWIALVELPRATVDITLKKIPISFSEIVEISSKITTPDISSPQKIILPGELISAKQNMQMNFQAGSKEQVERKARGTLILYNAFSSSPQGLLASTRFESSDGKIFRLNSKTTVPGAKIKDGEIIPSKIKIEVTADKAGEEYNTKPTSGWRIPGFKGTARYSGFYAENLEPMRDGFIGEKWVPTTEDKAKADIEIENALRDSLETRILVLIASEEFKIFKEATIFTMIKKEMQDIEKEPKKFGIYAEAEMKKLIFSEEMLKDTLIQKQKNGLITSNLKPIEFNLSYGTPSVDFSEGKLSVKMFGNAIFTTNVSVSELTLKIRGQDESSLRQTIFSLLELENASISLWPFWVRSVPENTEKIKILIR